MYIPKRGAGTFVPPTNQEWNAVPDITDFTVVADNIWMKPFDLVPMSGGRYYNLKNRITLYDSDTLNFVRNQIKLYIVWESDNATAFRYHASYLFTNK